MMTLLNGLNETGVVHQVRAHHTVADADSSYYHYHYYANNHNPSVHYKPTVNNTNTNNTENNTNKNNGKMIQLFLQTLTGKTITVDIHPHNDPNETLSSLKTLIYEREGIPPSLQRLTCGSKYLTNHRDDVEHDYNNAMLRSLLTHHATITIHLPLPAGKGGFGTLLKGQSKQAGAKTTLDFGACRDLSGRRLRHVNDEIKLRKFRELQERRERGEQVDEVEALKTESGIRNWHLMVPNWSDGAVVSGKGRRKAERALEREVWGWKGREERRKREREERRKEEEWRVLEYVRRGEMEGRRIWGDGGEVGLKDEILECLRKKKLGKLQRQQEQQLQSANALNSSKSDRTAREGMASAQMSVSASQTDITGDLTNVIPSQYLMTLSGEISVFDVPNSNGNGDVNNASTTTTKTEDDSFKPSKLRIQSQSDFATAVVLLDAEKLSELFDTTSEKTEDTMNKTLINSGLYLEYEIKTGGLAQIGWIRAPSPSLPSSAADDDSVCFLPNSDTGDGVGDDFASYGYDGSRGLAFHGGKESPYGSSFKGNGNGKGHSGDAMPMEWRTGDILGCWCILRHEKDTDDGREEKSMEIGYSLNGIDLGSAFTIDMDESHGFALYPAMSLNLGEVLDVNVGPDFAFDVKEACVGVSECIKRDIESDGGDNEVVEPLAGEGETNNENFKSREVDASKPIVDHVSPPRKKQREESSGGDEKGDRLNSKEASKPAAKPFDLNTCESVDELKALGADELKKILLSLGLKCG
ncbi:hypothetical protein ACHAXS_002465 [Conticribra weissflogii]